MNCRNEIQSAFGCLAECVALEQEYSWADPLDLFNRYRQNGF